jgi:hypothetical protein
MVQKVKSFLMGNILLVMTLILLFFIPVYPKLPLIDISSTWTYIRLEDFLTAISFIILTVYLIRTRTKIKTALLIPIVLFWLAGLISTIWAVSTVGTSDNWAIFKPHLIVLNYLRRIEYLGVFFVAFVAIKDWKGVKVALTVFVIAFALVVGYGFGQRFFGFSAYLTMNEEFAKGKPLPLLPGTRIPSTFGGHYDLAGYLVFCLPVILSLFFVARKKWQKIALVILSSLGFLLLIYTASRISFVAFFITLPILFVLLRQKKWLIPFVLLFFAISLLGGQDTILDRLAKTIRVKTVTVDKNTGKVLVTPTKDKDWRGLPESENAVVLPNQEGVATDSAQIVTKYEKGSPPPEFQPSASPAASPIGNVVASPSPVVTQTVTDVPTTENKKEIIEEVRVEKGDYEQKQAVVSDISFSTRLEAEWPRAVQAFMYNPLLGKGYSTITAATDSSYMRSIGEVGILGTVSFFAIFFVFARKAAGAMRESPKDTLRLSFVAGVVAGLMGLLVNATLIDIFEASKVAFVLWLVLGITMWVIEKGKVSAVE